MSDADLIKELQKTIANLEGQLREKHARIETLLSDADPTPLTLPWKLTATERRLLLALAKAGPAGVPRAKAEALCSPWGYVGSNVLASRMSTIRKALRPDGIEIETVYTLGYVITEGLDVVRKALNLTEGGGHAQAD